MSYIHVGQSIKKIYEVNFFYFSLSSEMKLDAQARIALDRFAKATKTRVMCLPVVST